MASVIPPNGTIRVVLGGQVSPQDVWSISLWFTIGELAGTPTQAQANTIATAMLSSFHTNFWAAAGVTSSISPLTSLSSCTAYFYDGTSSAAGTQGTAVQTVQPGSGSTSPAYVALAASLITGRAGRSGKGRVFLPMTGLSISATTMQVTSVVAIANAFKAALAGMVASFTVGGGSVTTVACVYSRKLNQLNSIDAISVDSLPDTQHGRTNKATAAAKSVIAFP